MTDILLIQVNYKNTTQFKRFVLDPPIPHIGLSYLASSLKKHNFNVKIIEGNLFDLSENDVLNLILSEHPRVIGITVTTPLLHYVYLLIKKIRLAQCNIKTLKDTTIVLGGPHITFLPESITDIGGDFGCIGESEENLPLLCNYLIRRKGSLSEINGIAYRDNGTLRKNEPKEIKDLDSLPFPDYDSFLLPNNEKPNLKEFPIMASRGCTFKCIYCYKSAKFNVREVAYVVDEMQSLIHKHKPKLIHFCDDTFTANKREVSKLTGVFLKRGIKTNWYCSTRADCVDRELLVNMHSAGCQIVCFGIESGSERIRSIINKAIPNETYIRVFRDCKEIGMRTLAFFMLGFPTETREDIYKTVQFTKKLNPNHICISLTTIMPGSYLHTESINKGLLNKDYWKRFMTGEEKVLPIFVPVGISLKEMKKMQIRFFLRFYFNPWHIIQEFKQIDNIKVFLKRFSKSLDLLRRIITISLSEEVSHK